ncbi:MAG: type III pantothenate kinase [bacterium]
MSGLLIAVDIGNTTILVGVFDGKRLVKEWRFHTKKDQTADEFGCLVLDAFRGADISAERIAGAVMSSVVPSLTDRVKEMCRNYLGCTPLEIDPGMEEYIPVAYPDPKQIGADRIVNAVAANEQYGAPLIIIDFGTATTFCALSPEGEFLGGCIVPGIGVSLEALIGRAERLSPVTWQRPASVIAKNTDDAIRAGLLFGYASLVKGIVERMRSEMGVNSRVVATGGWASAIQEEAECIDVVDPHLTLQGLRIIYERRRGGGR